MVARARGALLAAVVAIALAGCANPLAVPWPTYDPAWRAAIGSAVASRDCATLRALRAAARLTSDAHQRATGYSNENLIAYIDAALRGAGC